MQVQNCGGFPVAARQEAPTVPSTQAPAESRALQFDRRGAPLILFILLLLGFVAVQGYQLLRGGSEAAFDVRSVDSYGFDLSDCRVPRDELVGTLYGRGQQPPLDFPQTLAVAAWKPGTMLGGMYKLTSHDRVVGVTIAGQSRAYPLWVLMPHEVCNDSLGRRPIAVAHNPLCDSAVVFDRNVGGSERHFAASGLIYNSLGLLTDTQAEPRLETLWHPLRLAAVAGPLVGTALEPLVCEVVTFEQWRAEHPQSSIALPDPTQRRKYRPNGFLYYLNDDRLRYPVRPSVPSDETPLKTPVLAVRSDGKWRVTSHASAALADTGTSPRMYGFWFAIHAAWPEAALEFDVPAAASQPR
jgi:Protein of unknown function (DUF3179)